MAPCRALYIKQLSHTSYTYTNAGLDEFDEDVVIQLDNIGRQIDGLDLENQVHFLYEPLTGAPLPRPYRSHILLSYYS